MPGPGSPGVARCGGRLLAAVDQAALAAVLALTRCLAALCTTQSNLPSATA
jgi:hypothetical protein